MSTDSSSRIIRFSTFEVNLHTGELRQRGQKVRLQEQPLQVLTALLERPGELVTREELRSKLWPADTFVDFDHSLNAAIKRLRDALGESAERPVFIETLARRGYRFIGPVNGASAPSGIGIVTPAARRTPSFLRPEVAIPFLSAVGIAALLLALWRPRPTQPTEVIERKLTANSLENGVSGAAVSPDGKLLAYTDNTGIYLKQIRTGETHAVPLPPDFSADVNDWFPDGSHLLVTRGEKPGKQSLWSVSVFGGSPRQLAKDAAAGSVSPDGSHIAFRRFGFGQEEWVMRSDGTDPVKVSAAQSSWVGAPTWSPDGNRIAYVRAVWTYNARATAVEVNEWRNPGARTLFSDNRLGPALYWLRNGRLAYTLGDEINHRGASLWTVPSGKPGESPHRITRGIGWISQVTGSSDGKILTFLRGNSVSSVYIRALAPDGTHLLASRKLILDENENLASAWTPDGKAVLFSSDRNGTQEIFKQAVDQPLAENLVAGAEQLSQPRVTPDGSEVFYIATPKSATPEAESSILAVPITGGSPRFVLKDVGIWTAQCARSPSSICMYSIAKGDTTETFRFDVRSGKSPDPPQIDPSCNWSLSPNGLQRAMTCPGPKATIRLRSTLTGKTRDLPVDGWNQLGGIDWAADGRSLVVAAKTLEQESALLKVTLDGRASVLIRSSSIEILGAISSPDGRSLAVAETRSSNDVWEIESF